MAAAVLTSLCLSPVLKNIQGRVDGRLHAGAPQERAFSNDRNSATSERYFKQYKHRSEFNLNKDVVANKLTCYHQFL